MAPAVAHAAYSAWHAVMMRASAQDGPPPGQPSTAHHRILKVRLLAVTGREAFELVATSNDKFSMKLKYKGTILVRLCCSTYHKVPSKLGGGRVRGPHVHYHRPGYGTKYAIETDAFSHDDVNGALDYFLALCSVRDIPAIQEMLELK